MSKALNLKKIQDLIQDISDYEKSHESTSIKPTINKQTEEQESLTALARLLTGDRDQEKLMVATNSEDPKYPQIYMKMLKEYVNNPFAENYRKNCILF